MTIHFSCTMCGRCCHDLRLPLGVDEAIDWLGRNGRIQVFCDAIPWPEDPPASNLQAAYKRDRSFPAISGALPVRVTVTLVAAFQGACPNLQPDLRCGIYESRPRTCRIYPAEMNPFVALSPEAKLCPPEAWEARWPAFQNGDGSWTDPSLTATIDQAREAAVRDARTKGALCRLLGLDTAALANEGLMVHTPSREVTRDALLEAKALASHEGDHVLAEWTLVSNRKATGDALASIDARWKRHVAEERASEEYVGFFPADQ